MDASFGLELASTLTANKVEIILSLRRVETDNYRIRSYKTELDRSITGQD